VIRPIFVWLLTICAGLLFPALVLAQSPADEAVFVQGELLLKFNPHVSAVTQERVIRQVRAQTIEVLPVSGVLRVRVPVGQELSTIKVLETQPSVRYAEPNYILTTQQGPNDPSFSQQWGLYNIGQSGGTAGADIDALRGWDIGTGKQDVVIAIGDTGIDLDHPDLAGRIWTNPGEIAGNNLDDDNNGFIDDVKGWNFCSSAGCGSQNNNPDDNNYSRSHGTHVAGIAGATGNNGVGVTGVTWGATLMPVKVADYNGDSTVSAAASGIDYAVNNGADVINMSLASQFSIAPCSGFTTIQEAMQRALAKGVPVVFAAGNQSRGTVSCPAAFDEAIAVGATTDSDQRASFSNFGPTLDVVAPGDSIYSTGIGGYLYKNGTSMAAPHVAGLLGLMRSCSPNLSVAAARYVLETTADDLGSGGRDDVYGYGRINAYRALAMLSQWQPENDHLNLLVSDSGFSGEADQYTLALMAANPTAISWTAIISPQVSWLGLNTLSTSAMMGMGAPLTVTLVTTRPAPAPPGIYTTTVMFVGEVSGGVPLCPQQVEVRLNYTANPQFLYFPIIHKGGNVPDLVVSSVVAANDGVTVTIANEGDTAVTDDFWLDVYFDPDQTPGVNYPWNSIADYGQVWGVTAAIAPGETITFTTGGAYYASKYSSPLPLPVGADVYALVDSINYDTLYGNVLEQNERNNLSLKTVSVQNWPHLSVSQSVHLSLNGLPARER
jgi:subtilisin family serine protease